MPASAGAPHGFTCRLWQRRSTQHGSIGTHRTVKCISSVCFSCVCFWSSLDPEHTCIVVIGATPKLTVVAQQWYASLPSTGRAYKIHYHRVRYWVVYGFPVYHYRMPSQSYTAMEDVHASTYVRSRVTSMLMHEESGV